MSTQYTPAPWRLTSDSPTIIQRDYRNIGSDRGPLIASTMGHDNSGFYVSTAESLANARLIVAAPEMANLLRELVAIEGPQPGHVEWARKVQAVLAKVDGVSA